MSSLPTDDGGQAAPDATPGAPMVEVTMPQMGVSVAEGTVVAWHKQVGDWIAADETLLEISTDKIDTDVPSPVSGRLAEIVVDVEQTVAVGTVLARIATDAVAGQAHPAEHLGGQGPEEGSARRRYSPVVQRIAQSEGIDLSQVPGTGRGGRVRKQDVLAYAEQDRGRDGPLHIESPYREEAPVESQEAPVESQEAPNGAEPQRLSRMRRSIADHVLRSLQTAAHCTSIVEADMGGVDAARRALGLTYLPFVARCVIDALRAHPALNATLEGEALTRHREVNLGIAVSLDQDGLIVPVIHGAQELSPEGLAGRISDLARRARAGQLSPDEVSGGTFTITNPGGYGTIVSTPIINQPQVAILDLEAVVKRPVVITDGAGRDSIAIRPMAYLCLSWDHRALDGALAARFLGTLRRRIESWEAA